MGVIWWILPAIAGVVGLMLCFAGFSKMGNLKPVSGMTRMLFGVGFVGLALVVAIAGVNLQTYERLTKERPVAEVKFVAVEGQPNAYTVDLTYQDGNKLLQADGAQPVLKGDQFEIGAQIIKFKPMANMLGYDSIYRLDYIEGRNARRFNAQRVTTATTNGIVLANNPGIDVYAQAQKNGKQFGIDAEYGNASYQPMGDGFTYSISISQDALLARPDTATRMKLGLGDRPDASESYVNNNDRAAPNGSSSTAEQTSGDEQTGNAQ